MKSVRIIAAALALIMLLTAFISCGGESGTAAETTTAAAAQTETAETEPLDALEQRKLVPDELPAKDFNGRKYRVIHNSDSMTASFLADEEASGDVVKDAVYERNSTVEERFNAELIFDNSRSYQDTAGFVATSVLAGEDAFDLVSSHIVSLSANALKHVLLNWYDLSYVDFEKPWWSRSCKEDLTLYNTALIVVGDMAMSALGYTYCMYFDKGFAEDYKMGDIYETVLDGRWTVDLLNDLTKDIYNDINGNSVKDMEDFCGLGFRVGSHTNTFLWAFNNPVVSIGSDGEPSVSISVERITALLEKVNTLCNVNPGGMPITDYTAAYTFFKNGHCVFSLGEIGNSVSYFRDMDRDYGIIPYPKWDEAQERYRTSVNGAHEGMAVPLTISDADFVGIITEALCAESYKQVVPAYYDVALKYKGARDETSIELLDLIVDGRYFDFGFIYDNWKGPCFMLEALVKNNSSDFASAYAAKEAAITAHYQSVFDAIAEYSA